MQILFGLSIYFLPLFVLARVLLFCFIIVVFCLFLPDFFEFLKFLFGHLLKTFLLCLNVSLSKLLANDIVAIVDLDFDIAAAF